MGLGHTLLSESLSITVAISMVICLPNEAIILSLIQWVSRPLRAAESSSAGKETGVTFTSHLCWRRATHTIARGQVLMIFSHFSPLLPFPPS